MVVGDPVVVLVVGFAGSVFFKLRESDYQIGCLNYRHVHLLLLFIYTKQVMKINQVCNQK